jgi:cytolysin-activating lysine-acyltransferase
MVESKQEISASLVGSSTSNSQSDQSHSEVAETTDHASISPTIASHLGEMVWLLSQSARHRHLSISDLEWMLMPPLLLGQYKLYHKNKNPIALALWAYLNQDDEQRLLTVNKLRPEAWCAGDARRLLSPPHSPHPPGLTTDIDKKAQLWLIELIAPSASVENKLSESVLSDLVNTVFKRQGFKLHVTNPQTGIKEIQEISGH